LPGYEPLACNLAVDSGAYSALRLYRPYLKKHHLLELHAPLIDSFGFGLGGEFPEKLGRVSSLRIGSLAVKEPVTSFSDARSGATSGSDYDGTIGGAVLDRFKVIFDYPHQQIILEPTSSFSSTWRVDTSGLILRASGAHLTTISVLHVLGNTPAAAAGIKEGDIIMSVDGQDSSRLGLEGMRRLFANSGDYHLQLRSGQQNREIHLRTVAPLF